MLIIAGMTVLLVLLYGGALLLGASKVVALFLAVSGVGALAVSGVKWVVAPAVEEYDNRD